MQSFRDTGTAVPSPDPAGDWREKLVRGELGCELPVTRGNTFQLLVDGAEFLGPMVQLIDSAKETLSFQFLNMEADAGGLPVAGALIRAARRGVIVRGILDYVSQTFETNGRVTFWPWTRWPVPVARERSATRGMFREMRGEGIDFKISFPWFYNGFNRMHRKSIVVDRRVLMVGGFNPTEHNLAWHEICAVLRGPVALEVERLFNGVAEEAGIPAMPLDPPETEDPPGPGHRDVTIGLALNEPRTGICIRNHFVRSVDSARTRVRVENAYFSDPACFEALVRAARRGVRVQLIVPRASNHASVDRKRDLLIPALAAAGGEVYLYRGMTHAKVFMVDDTLASIGSANFTPLNLRMERELNIVATDRSGDLGRELAERVFEKDIANSDRPGI